MFVGEEWGVRGHWGPRVVVETRSMGSFAKVVVVMGNIGAFAKVASSY